jgi:hypothetical protein
LIGSLANLGIAQLVDCVLRAGKKSDELLEYFSYKKHESMPKNNNEEGQV